MKLLGRVAVGASLIPFLLACSEDKTILSVNVNMGSDKLNRRASLWQPIEVTIVGTTTKTQQLTLPTREEDVIVLQANGSAMLNEMMEPAKEKALAVKNQWFERIELDGWSGSATVTAKTTGAYFVDEQVGGNTYPKSVPVMFSTGPATVSAGGIKIELTPTPIEEEGVAAVFLNFNPPEMPMAGGGMAAGGAGGGGAGGTATGGTATGGTATGGTPAMAGAGGMAGGAGGATVAGSGGGGTGGA
jgi:hypothetical protein